MHANTAAQFSAVYAEAAIAWIETEVPQAILWFEDEDRWDFRPGDEDVDEGEVAFVLQRGWDGQLSLDNETDVDGEAYDSSALRDEIEQQMMDEGVAKALIENLSEHRDRLAEGDADDDDSDDEERDDDEGDS